VPSFLAAFIGGSSLQSVRRRKVLAAFSAPWIAGSANQGHVSKRRHMVLRRSLFALVLASVAGCDLIVQPQPRTQQTLPSDSLPPLEPIPFDLLGHSTLVFERLSTYQFQAGGIEPLGGIYVIDAAARHTYPLIDYRKLDGAAPALSPDGKTVAFTAYADDFPCCGRQLYVVNVDGTNLRRIGSHTDGKTFSPSWWPSGNEVLARVTDKTGTSFYRQAATPAASPSLVVRIESNTDSVWNFGGQVSVANGRMLISASSLSASSLGLTWNGFATMNEDGSGLARFFADPSFDWIFAPTWSPDGQRIAFLGGYFDVFGQWTTQVVVMNADGSDEQLLTAVPSIGAGAEAYVGSPNAFSLCWLSTGSIVFSAPVEAGLWHLYVVSTKPPVKVHALTRDIGAQDTSVSCAG
jgi:hypothetical protein